MIGRLSGLSPRRRALVVVAGGAVAALVAGLLVRGVLGVVGGGRERGLPADDRPGAVVLVPGYGGGAGGLRGLAERIRGTGRTATVVDLPGNGTGDLGEQARALDDAVGAALRAGAPSVDVIGHSAGGVVARLWSRDHDGAGKARRIVSLGSPHRGADLAAAGGALVPGACQAACRQLAPGSALLDRLGPRVPAHPAWMSVWTTADQIVRPPDSARLAGAVNVALQDLCPGVRTGHAELPGDRLVTALVLRAIGAAPLRPPAAEPAGCSG